MKDLLRKPGRRSIRLKGYDYSEEGGYFVTICTKNRRFFFGTIVDAEMKLSEIGEIAKRCWMELPEHFENILLDDFVVMPDHFHGIIIIRHPIGDHQIEGNSKRLLGGDVQLNVPTSKTSSKNQLNVPTINQLKIPTNYRLTIPSNQSKTNFPQSPKKGTLSVIIRTYKAAVTTICRQQGFHQFAWQSLFYDRIIRDEDELGRIREYISNNVLKWQFDRKNPEHKSATFHRGRKQEMKGQSS